MIQNAFTGEPKANAKSVEQQQADFTAEGAPPAGNAALTLPFSSDTLVQPVPSTTGVTGAVAVPMPQPGLWPTGLPGVSFECAIEDCLLMFAAVNERLRQAASDAPLRPLNGDAMPLRLNVQQCVAALDQLHERLTRVLADDASIGNNWQR